VNIPFGPLWEGTLELDSFHKRGLAKPGVLVKIEGDGNFLIGHVNDEGGVCGCCSVIRPNSVVEKYKVLCKL
jgi:hypothetical protein